ncbi:MAG: sulfotransferase [Jiangellaceae bacterium]
MKTKKAHRRALVAVPMRAIRTLPGFRSYPLLYVGSALKARRLRADLASIRAFLLFIGHPRSGHSLVGSLLDAHPEMAVAHELDALDFVAAGYGRDQLFSLVLDHTRHNAQAGRKSWGYSYAVPGQWQGRYRRLEVVGDKRGRKTTARLRSHPELLDRLTETVQVPVKVVQVVRNPYDNIATMYARGHAPLEHQIELYFTLSDTTDSISGRLEDSRFHRLHLEDLVADAKGELAALCDFLDVSAEPDYLGACASIVFPSAHTTRSTAPWTPELLGTVARQSADHPWLGRYRFDEED